MRDGFNAAAIAQTVRALWIVAGGVAVSATSDEPIQGLGASLGVGGFAPFNIRGQALAGPGAVACSFVVVHIHGRLGASSGFAIRPLANFTLFSASSRLRRCCRQWLPLQFSCWWPGQSCETARRLLPSHRSQNCLCATLARFAQVPGYSKAPERYPRWK